ncbi:hypothetical protein [Acidilobus sp.]|uniref:hypothetical protein n=1 Tax=Acidilobus sp. TaxID=1872109 RepID=UPI003D08337E
MPEGSYTAYFDLDDEYNTYFHRSIDWEIATGSPRPLHYLVRRDYAIDRGGWRDLREAMLMRRYILEALGRLNR